MKIQAIANAEVREATDEEAQQLIEAGIYEAADEQTKPKPAAPPPTPKKPPGKSTKVEPLTTEDMPAGPPKKVK